MTYSYTPVPILANGNGMDLDVINTLANNDEYFNRVVSNISYRWLGNKPISNSGGVDRITVQSGTVAIAPFKGDKDINVSLNRAAANNNYPVTLGLRHGRGVQATYTVFGQTNKGFQVRISPVKPNIVYSSVHLTWIAIVPIAG